MFLHNAKLVSRNQRIFLTEERVAFILNFALSTNPDRLLENTLIVLKHWALFSRILSHSFTTNALKQSVCCPANAIYECAVSNMSRTCFAGKATSFSLSASSFADVHSFIMRNEVLKEQSGRKKAFISGFASRRSHCNDTGRFHNHWAKYWNVPDYGRKIVFIHLDRFCMCFRKRKVTEFPGTWRYSFAEL